MLLILIFSTNQGWWKRSDHSNLAHTEKFAIYGQRLIFQNLVGEIIVQLRFLSNRRTNLTLAPAIRTSKGSQHQGILASVRCNNLVTTLMLDIQVAGAVFGVWMHMCGWVEVCFAPSFSLCYSCGSFRSSFFLLLGNH